MKDSPARITLEEWDARYAELRVAGLREPWYGGPLRRHVDEGGDYRLLRLRYDNSPAALRLWNFLLTEEDRLKEARRQGKKLVGAMKDLGTVPVMAYSLANVTAFYPDGAWWIPCMMELSSKDLEIADSLGIDESFCPVRAMLGAFLTEAHFPIPDLLTCNVGATCDDFSAIAQRLNGLGYPILWWETPHRRKPKVGQASRLSGSRTEQASRLSGSQVGQASRLSGSQVGQASRLSGSQVGAGFKPIPAEESVPLPGGLSAPREQVDFVRSELERVRGAIEELAGGRLDDAALRDGIRVANRMRRVLAELRELSYSAPVCPIPALEMLIAEMLALHFCSDREEAIRVLEELLEEARRRVGEGIGPLREDAVRVFWVNPVADLRAMNILEDCGGRVCGTEYLFSHALDEIPENLPPMEALARTALADPMVGPCSERADRICRDIQLFGAEAVLVSRIPGASHCAVEGAVIHETVRKRLGLPVQEIEVPPLCDAVAPTIRTRIEALIETVKGRRKP
jgi:hypothetical protein